MNDISRRLSGVARGAARVVLALALAGGFVSCVEVVPYRPNTAFADGLEERDVQRRFGEAMTRAVAPRILSARIAEHFYEYEVHATSRNVYAIPIGVVSRKVQRDFADLGRTQLHVNHVVYVYSKSGRLLDQLRFADGKDARLFVDVIMSHRARLARSWSDRD